MKHSVSFTSVIVPQLGHSFVVALGGPGAICGGGGGGTLVIGAAGARGTIGGGAMDGAIGGAGGMPGPPPDGGGASSCLLRRFANTRKYSSAPMTAMRMTARIPPTTTKSAPAGRIVKAPLSTVFIRPSPSMTVSTIFTSAASMLGAVQSNLVIPWSRPGVTAFVTPPEV